MISIMSSDFYLSFHILVKLHLTELMLMLPVVWLSGEGLLAVADAVPAEARVGKVMSWMPCGRACCFWRSLIS